MDTEHLVGRFVVDAIKQAHLEFCLNEQSPGEFPLQTVKASNRAAIYI